MCQLGKYGMSGKGAVDEEGGAVGTEKRCGGQAEAFGCVGPVGEHEVVGVLAVHLGEGYGLRLRQAIKVVEGVVAFKQIDTALKFTLRRGLCGEALKLCGDGLDGFPFGIVAVPGEFGAHHEKSRFLGT